MRFERSLRDNTRTARDTATRYRASAARKSTSIATSSWTLMRRPIADLFSKPGRQLAGTLGEALGIQDIRIGVEISRGCCLRPGSGQGFRKSTTPGSKIKLQR